MTSIHPHRDAQRGTQGSGRTAPGSATALLLLYGLVLTLIVIAAYTFGAELAAVLEWGSSPEPWWRP